MPLTKMKTAQRQTSAVVVNSSKMTRTVESFSSTTTSTTLKTFSQSSGKSLEDWSLASFASPQTWVPGNKALFLSPKSPSPKLRVTRRSSIYVNKTKSGKSKTPESGKEFKAPLPAKIKAISSPVSTRTRRSSVYKKGSAGTLGVTSFQVAQEFRSKPPGGKRSPKSKAKSPVSVKGGRKRGMVDVEVEDSFEQPAAKRQRGQPEAPSPVLSPEEKKQATSKQKSKSKIVKSRQAATASRARKGAVSKGAKSPSNKKKADTTKSKAATPVESTPASGRKRGRFSQSRSKTAEKEVKNESSTPAADQLSKEGKSQARKRKLPLEDLQATPTKSVKKTPKSVTRPSKSTSKSKSVKKSARKTRKVSTPASSPALLGVDDLVDEVSTPVSQSKSARRKAQRITPKSGSASKNRSVSKSSTRKSASKSASKTRSARKSVSTKKTKSTRKTARRQITVGDEASVIQDGSFLQMSVQKLEAASLGQSMRSESPAHSEKRLTKKSPTPKKSASVSKSGKGSGKQKLRQQSAKSPSGDVAAEQNVHVAAVKSSEKSQKRKSTSVTRHAVLENADDTLDGSYVQFAQKTSEKAVKRSKTPSKSASSSVSPVKSATKSTSERQPASARKQKTTPSAKTSTPAKQQSSTGKRKTPSARATPSNRESSSSKKLKSIQLSAVSSVKRLNPSPRRTPVAVITSTPRSIGKAKPGSLRKSLLMSLQKSAVADDSFDGNARAVRASKRSVVARRSLGKPAVSSSGALQSSFGSASFTQYMERKSHDTVERYSSAGFAHTEGGHTYQAGGYRVERESLKFHESKEEFGEWADDNINNSAVSTPGSGDLSFASSTYSSRCAIL